MSSRPRVVLLVKHRVAPLTGSFTGISTEHVREIFTRIGGEMYGSHQRLQKHGFSAVKMQLLVVRNALACVVCAVVTNACYYAGNIFSGKPSTLQSHPEVLMATLVWTTISYCTIMLVAHLPSLMTQRFLERPNYRPGVWFCMKKLLKGSRRYFAFSLGSMLCLGLLVQHTPIMEEYKLHYYLGDLCNLTFTAGITLVVRRIYYKETQQGRDRSLTLKESLKGKPSTTSSPRLTDRARPYRAPSFWREYRKKLPDFVFVALAGGYVHVVSSSRILDHGEVEIMAFAASSIAFKLAIQETARWYIIKKGVRSIQTMCVLVGVPTVLIDTQTRIILMGTQTNTFLVAGTLGMAIAEVCLRAAKAAFILWTIRRRAMALEHKQQKLSTGTLGAGSSPALPSPSPRKLEFDLWRRQVLAYHTAELTTDMYAEYLAIGCSQSIMFWFVGHPMYPALNFKTNSSLADAGVAKWRLGKVAMLGFQFFLEVLVDYVSVVIEMAIGIEFDRIKGLSAFLGVLFTAMAVLTINISATIYLDASVRG